MADAPINLIKELRDKTGAGFGDCKKALSSIQTPDIEQAIEWLKKQGLSQMAKRAGKEASEGTLASYVHNGRIAVLVEVNSETDFAARSEDFQKFVKDLTLHITAMSPVCVSADDMGEDVLKKQEELFKAQALEEGKSEKILPKIIEGRLEKWKQESCLMSQIFSRPGSDDDEEITVNEALAELVNKVRENIVIRRFVRYELGQ